MAPAITALTRISRGAAIGFAFAASAAFLLWTPAVGDYWAAEARRSAALHGVGLRYWFSWFGGLVPGHYSLIDPLLSRVVAAGVLGALSTVVATVGAHVLVRGSAHATAASWAAAVGASFSLWSGRVPFALGTAVMVAALSAVRYRRPYLAAGGAVLTAAVSPVSGAFLAFGLIGVALHDSTRRRAALLCAGLAAACVGAGELYFGSPGPEGFLLRDAALAVCALAVMLLARPAPYVRTIVVLALVACPLLVFIPNGLGSNFERLTWICLPVAVLATARAGALVACIVCGLAIACGVVGSVRDLYVAAQPMSRPAYLNGLVAAVDRLPNLPDHRLEIVPDGTHVAAYALLDHAQLARGYETQTDHARDAVLFAPRLAAATYRHWLDAEAVGWVALNRNPLSGNVEDTLVRRHRPAYLRLAWSDAHWLLYAVVAPMPIVAPPGTVVDADQANLVIRTPAGATAVRVRWSPLLTVHGPEPARLRPDGRGWTVLVTRRAGQYVLAG